VSKDGQFRADGFSLKFETVLVDVEAVLVEFDGELGLGGILGGGLRALGDLDSDLAELVFQLVEGEGDFRRCSNILRKGGDGLGGDLFGSAVAAVDGFPESNDPGSVEFVGQVNFAD